MRLGGGGGDGDVRGGVEGMRREEGGR